MGQRIIKGTKELPDLLKQYKRILLVHGKSYDSYGLKSIFDSVDRVEFTDFSPNPLYEDVCKGVEMFHDRQCDAIAAVGGGSAIDVAKCIKLFSGMERGSNYLQQEKRDTQIPLLAIPTTAGTGSESTRHAVIYAQGTKQSVSHGSIVPDYAVLVPELLEGLPLYQKKCTMLDALCQAIESWWSVNSTEESIAYSRKAILSIMENWEDYIFDYTPEAAEKIMEAANDSGRAINITATTAAHAMSYKITSLYNLPHGHAVAICLPEVWSYMLEHTRECSDVRGDAHLRNVLEQIADYIQPEQFNRMLDKLEITGPTAGDRDREIQMLVQSVNPERLKNLPVRLSTETIKDMYGRIIRE